MDIEALAKTKIGRWIFQMMAAIMESRLRYKLFGPTKILQGAGIQPGMQVLEVGCGTGFFTLPAGRMLRGQGSLIAMDILPASVEAVSEKVREADLSNVRVIQGNALKTELETESLDAILIFGVIPAPVLPLDRLLPEMHRVLKPGGTIAVWPPSWVHRSIAESRWFQFVGKHNGVYCYQRADNKTH